MTISDRSVQLFQRGNYWVGQFKAMSCPCEVLMSGCDEHSASYGLEVVSKEAWRIEDKFSRFRVDSVIGQINKSSGQPIEVDDETSRLFDCAQTLHDLSEGMFDITAGSLGKVWKFNQKGRIPTQPQIDKILPLIGWEKVCWNAPIISLQENMAVDFGGIGKEYAVDRCLALLGQAGIKHGLVNLGGDVASNAPQVNGNVWQVGVEQVNKRREKIVISLKQGALATSGDQRRYIKYKGKRYSHVLNPQTGWPIEQAPKSVTTAAINATEAGMYSTLAMLSGKNAEQFLSDNQVQNWVQR